MGNAFVQVQTDGPGKKVQTFENTVGGQLVEAQAIVAVDSTGAAIAPALDATLTGGSAKSIARGGAKGSTVAADVTSTPSGANHQGADVCLYDAAGNLIDPRSIRALTTADAVTATIGTDSVGLAKDATLTGGSAKAIARGGQKGTTNTNADITHTASGSNHEGLDVCLYDAAGNLINPTAIRALTASDVVTATQGTAAALSGAWPAKITDGTNAAAVKAASTAAAAADPSAVVALSPNSPVPAGTNRIGSVRPVDSADADLTTAKGSQSSRFLGTQDAKDSGRVNIMWTAEFSPAATAEALLTLTESRDGATTTTFSSKVVTSGKRLRITSLTMTVENTLGTSLQRAYLRMRFNTAGAVTTGSAQQGVWAGQAAGTVKSISQPTFEDFPDGVEFLGDGTKQIGFTMTGPDWVSATSTLKVYVTIFGYEY